jgi:transposase
VGDAWRAADSLSPRSFLSLALAEASPNHSTISRTHRLIDLETHEAIFTWVLQRLAGAGLVRDTTIGIDGTTLEATPASRSIVRRDTGEDYASFLTQLSRRPESSPTREDCAGLDRQLPVKGRNSDWVHPQDPDARLSTSRTWPSTA